MRRPVVIIAIIVGLVGIVVVGAAAFFGFQSFQRFAAAPEAASANLRFHSWFLNPQNNSQLPLGSALEIHAKAEGPAPVTAIELWVDGEMVQVIQAPQGSEKSPFHAHFGWLPEQEGSYNLLARAYNSLGQSTTSQLLKLEIVPEQALSPEKLAAAYPDIPSAPGVSNNTGGGSGGPYIPYSSPPDPTDNEPPQESDPAQPWTPSLIQWIGNMVSPINQLPAAPSIVSAVESCRPRLFIADHSDNEAGFNVYRLDPGQGSFAKIETLAAFDGPALSFDDEDLYGSFQYYVSAFNAFGEADSNIVSVDVLSENCAPEPQDGLQINLGELLAAESFDLGYCYYSLDGIHWQRHPADPDDFFPTGEAADEGFNPLFTTINPDVALPLELECWGWAGAQLDYVGKWSWEDIGNQDLDPINDDSTQAGIDNPLIFSSEVIASVQDFDLQKIKNNLSIPSLVAWTGSTPEQCAQWSNIPNPIVLGLICGDIAEELDFLVWQVQPGCPDRYADPDAFCWSADDIAYFNVYDTMHDGGKTPVQTIDPPSTLYFLFDPESCAPRHLWVTAVVDINGVKSEGVWSNQVYYPGNPLCPVLTGEQPQRFRMVWQTIDFSIGNIDDGVDATDDVEAYGKFGIWNTDVVNIRWILQFYPVFDDDDSENPYYFADLPLCQGGQYIGGCSIGESNQHLLHNHNTADFNMYLGETIDIYMELWDKDDGSSDDIICSLDPYVQDIQFTVDHIFEPGERVSFVRERHHNSASCRVRFYIEAIP